MMTSIDTLRPDLKSFLIRYAPKVLYPIRGNEDRVTNLHITKGV